MAVVGAGVAGSSCARTLADAGLVVEVFDKSRGVGGRLATRRASWADAAGVPHEAAFDHGVPAFSAHDSAFEQALCSLQRHGLVEPWLPQRASGHAEPLGATGLWVAAPDMPALCREWLQGVAVHTATPISALRRESAGWVLEAAGTPVGEGFTAVVVAVPPAQAATLLQPASPAHAARLAALPMLPCWTLMGVAYMPQRGAATPYLWDPAQALGACGDALGGGGVEGAWLSGKALAQAVLAGEAAAPRAARELLDA